jgi:predicted helicase
MLVLNWLGFILSNYRGGVLGLADTSKTTLQMDSQQPDARTKSGFKQIDKDVHRVQILDPTTGTGTFLAEVIRQIHAQVSQVAAGGWQQYVPNDLIPRLNGFELLMAPYAMAHLKLDIVLRETGYEPTDDEERFRVFLTNSLEEFHPETGTLYSAWLSEESQEADHVKRDTPVMVVLGNPPYSGESANKGEWIMGLMEDYKKEPGGEEKLKERNPKWINDDYVKFLRYGQYFIERNGEGILAFINPHGFLDNPTFRGMRWHLLKTYDAIYTLDLHGNTKKKETAPDGSKDGNVFDIQQGVSINFFVKTGKKKPDQLAKLFHYDLYGTRETKYDFLLSNSLYKISSQELPLKAPNYFFVAKNFALEKQYRQGYSLDELFITSAPGIVTARDKFTIYFSKREIEKEIKKFMGLDDETARREFNLGKDVRDWTVAGARTDLKESGLNFANVTKITYRPFEDRFTYFTGKTKGFHCMPRGEVMKHIFHHDNLGLIVPKQVPEKECPGAFITKHIAGHKTCSAYNINSIFPLYLYLENKNQRSVIDNDKRKPNLNTKITYEVAQKLNLRFTPEKEDEEGTFAPIDLLDYIYAVLHSSTYRDTYKEFLKIDFPRVPYPKPETFWQLVSLGGRLRNVHLLETPLTPISKFEGTGDSIITHSINKRDWTMTSDTHGSIAINNKQAFTNVPKIAWEFYIGGYQPAQKWLKDRKKRQLDLNDILHYHNIIAALHETHALMQEIDQIEL